MFSTLILSGLVGTVSAVAPVALGIVGVICLKNDKLPEQSKKDTKDFVVINGVTIRLK